jgi:deoxyribodipyrimidine photo-lyase
MKELCIYWTRRDFRLNDNPALFECTKHCKKEAADFLPVFILEDYMTKAEAGFQFGYASRYLLSKIIPEFYKKFKKFHITKGKGAEFFINLQKKLKETHTVSIFVNDDIYIDFHKQIKKIQSHGIKCNVFNDQLTIPKDTKTSTGSYYSVFTPFKKNVWQDFMNASVLPQAKINDVKYFNDTELPHKIEPKFESIWKMFSKKRILQVDGFEIDLDQELEYKQDFDKLDNFYYTEEECLKRFQKYLKSELSNYKENRDSLEKDQTSKMSLGLAWGLISARTLKKEITSYYKNDFNNINWFNINQKDTGVVHFLTELIWREFYKYLMFHNPKLMHQEFQEKFRGRIKWVSKKESIKRFTAWIQGKTGYKVVDAAMTQLAKTGWMHNRSRMIVASVLTKNLGVDWRWGQEYFRAMLLDLDEASNNGGWQWGASVGADPKPIRIFNPYLQAKNYDPNNIYQTKWLGKDGFLSETKPLIEHAKARNEALNRYGLSSQKHIPVRDY